MIKVSTLLRSRKSDEKSLLQVNIRVKVSYYYIKASLNYWVVGWANQDNKGK